MFRTLRIKDASVEVQECQQVASPPPGEKCWIDLEDFGSTELELLRKEFKFHPLAIEDCSTSDQRAKAEEYGDHLFIVIHALALGAGNGEVLEDEQVAAFLGERYLVTVHRKPIKQLETVWRRALTDGNISDKAALYFRDVYDHVMRAYEEIDTERDLLGNAMEAYISMMENRTNNIMKQLTIFASIFLPLTFLTGFFGQNFTMLPVGSAFLYRAMLTVCAAVPIGMLLWFRWRDWL